MVPHLRQRFNASFSEEKYQAFIRELHPTHSEVTDFRIAETPVFVSRAFEQEMINLYQEVAAHITSQEFRDRLSDGVPAHLRVPGEDAHPDFMCIDFAVCKDDKGQFFPQVIEMQGVPSLYAYQMFLNRMYKKYFDIPEACTPFYHGMDEEAYIAKLREVFVGDTPLENTILLEIEPHRQKTRIDFIYTEQLFGIPQVCVTEIWQEGRELYYLHNGQKTRVLRVYNRVIFDELERRPDLKLRFDFHSEIDVRWVAHPNWFFKLSKYTLPFIRSKYVPETHFLHQLSEIPADLENWVLKPLFSFAGAGVVFDVKREDIDQIPADQRQNYILMRKVTYDEFIETPDGPAKAEIRILCVWQNHVLTPVINLARISKGKMLGVDFNKKRTWVGGSALFFER